MKYSLLNWCNGRTSVVCEIEASTKESDKKGQAILWCIDNSASPAGSDLCGATLQDKDLSEINLKGSDIRSSVFERCNFDNASFNFSNMGGARFVDCTFKDADMKRCDMDSTQFIDCKFNNTLFNGSNIRKTVFDGSNLNGCKLFMVHGVNKHIRSAQIDTYCWVWTAEDGYIGCTTGPLGMLFNVIDVDYITQIDGEKGGEHWKKWESFLKDFIPKHPAEPVPRGRAKVPKRNI